MNGQKEVRRNLTLKRVAEKGLSTQFLRSSRVIAWSSREGREKKGDQGWLVSISFCVKAKSS